MARAFILLCDSVGCGGAPDAADFFNIDTDTGETIPDTGANTLGNLANWRAKHGSPLHLPHLSRLGLGLACQNATGEVPAGLEWPSSGYVGVVGSAIETSLGKDTPSGHYEICGSAVDVDWGYFPREIPCFPDTLIEALTQECGLGGVLGNKHASGTAIINELGEEHCRTDQPIVYTSADSVFQIAAHEETFGLARLYQVCEAARKLCDPLNIGRVIARPFIGNDPSDFRRTGNRKDYAVPPPVNNLLDRVVQAGGLVWSVGKIEDIFAHRSISRTSKVSGLEALWDSTLDVARRASDGDLIFTNFVDFDSKFGHRRLPEGYASALEYWDSRLPELFPLLRDGDLVLWTADHGNDPTWRGTDHTREQVPMLFFGPAAPKGMNIGTSSTFADMGATLAKHLQLSPLFGGNSVL
ncbi:MAG: phosphopentomutase [Alphaproteobacteria bacterium TMED89]|nr:phosphopentomutase [Rhodospirillaceae bacterium]RPH17133.1 MAG: phosphopentomutase [Alphaproteobacteria bacterium TMED89]